MVVDVEYGVCKYAEDLPRNNECVRSETCPENGTLRKAKLQHTRVHGSWGNSACIEVRMARGSPSPVARATSARNNLKP